MIKKIGWFGLGKIGVPMAMNVQKAGFDLQVYNRSNAKAENLRAAGAAVDESPATLAARSDIQFVILSDDNALRQVVLGEDGLLANMRPRAILIGMSTKQFFLGDGELARFLKLSLNMMVGMSAGMMGEAMTLGLKKGLDRDTTLDVMAASAIATPLINFKVATLKSRDYTPAFAVAQMAKDYKLILDAAHDSAVPMPLAAQVKEGWGALTVSVDGDQDFFKYVELSARLAGLDGEL